MEDVQTIARDDAELGRASPSTISDKKCLQTSGILFRQSYSIGVRIRMPLCQANSGYSSSLSSTSESNRSYEERFSYAFSTSNINSTFQYP